MAWTTPGTAVAGEVLTAAFWNEQVRDNSLALYNASFYLGRETRSTNYSVSSTTFAGADDVFASDISIDAVNGKLYRFEFFFPVVVLGTDTTIYFGLVDGSGNLIAVFSELLNASATIQAGPNTCGSFLYAAGSGTVSFNVRVRKSGGGNSAINATGGDRLPMSLTIYGPVD